MGSVSSANAGLAYLNQLLSGSGSTLVSSGLSSSQMQTALQSAPTNDIVELSNQAMQLQNLDSLFGIAQTSTTPSLFPTSTPSSSSDTLNNILATLSSGSSQTSANPITSSLSYQLAAYQNEQQGEEIQTLSVADSTTGV